MSNPEKHVRPNMKCPYTDTYMGLEPGYPGKVTATINCGFSKSKNGNEPVPCPVVSGNQCLYSAELLESQVVAIPMSLTQIEALNKTRAKFLELLEKPGKKDGIDFNQPKKILPSNFDNNIIIYPYLISAKSL